MTNINNEEMLQMFHPTLRKIIAEIWINGKIGLSSRNMNLIPRQRKIPVENKETYIDHFLVEVPYAGRLVSGEVYFSPADFKFAPDFDFNDDEFLSELDVDTMCTQIPSLLNWNVRRPESLVQVMREFLQLYKQEHLRKLERLPKYSQVLAEYQNLIEDGNITENNIEVLADNSCVHFLFEIVVDFSVLPVYAQEKDIEGLLNPREDTACLKLSFMNLNGKRVHSNLQLSPRLEQVIGASSDFRIPAYSHYNVLKDYVNAVIQLLKDKVDETANAYKLRNEFISEFLSSHSCSVIEYDNKLFSKITLMLGVDGFYVLIVISLNNCFPQDRPFVELRSIYKMANNKPASLCLKDYPYSPRWNPAEIVQRLTEKILQTLPEIKQNM